MLREIGNLDISKLSQEVDSVDVLAKIIKENSNIFASVICKSFNNMIDSSIFSAALKLAHMILFEKGSKNLKENYRPVSILPNISKFMADACINKCQITLEILSSNLNVVFNRHSVRSTVF